MLPVCPLVSWESKESKVEKDPARKLQIPGELRDVTSLPLARAKPPPSRNTMFQGIFSCTTFQSSRGGGARNFALPSGTQKRDSVKPQKSPKKGRTSWWEVGAWSGLQESLLSANTGIISWSKRWEHQQQWF